MSAGAQESQSPVGNVHDSWSRSRWIAYVAVAFAIHIALILAFGNRNPLDPRAVVNAPRMQLPGSRGELDSLDDPTLFALPHASGFGAAAWRQLPRVEFAPFRWTEPAQLLDLPVASLGSSFLEFAQTNPLPKIEMATLTPIQTLRLGLEESTSLRQHSTVIARGGVATRRWLNAPALLRSWPAADLLTNSVVRVIVDADGQVFSPVLLPPGCGSKTADQYALDVARSARFAPLPRNAEPVIGALVFAWHTEPMPETNASPTKP